MNKTLRALIIEDSPLDAELVLRELRRGNFTVAAERVDTATALAELFDRQSWDIVLSDYSMPSFNALDALQIAQEKSVDAPFIIVSGAIGEEQAAAAMRAGAHDFIRKDNLARLLPAVHRELEETQLRREKRQLETQLFHSQRMEGLGTLVSGIAHDLNNILSPILMSAQLLRMKPLDPDSQRLVAISESNAKHGGEIVAQLLGFARKVEGKRTLVDLRLQLREYVKLFRRTFPPSISIETVIPSKLWVVTADATQVYQVLLNLCVNARDAMPSGGVLRINAKNIVVDETYARMLPDAKPGPFVLVTVADTGEGIPSHIINRIFDPFFTTKEAGKGTGLGLSTVLGIVKNHGGFVRVESAFGHGTTFEIFLPATATEPPESEEQAEIPTGQGELILLTEDEPDIREMTARLLKGHGYTVLVATDGTEALALFARHLGDVKLVLTDFLMPFLDGIGLAKAVREMDPQVKVIISSGSDLGQEKRFEELKAAAISAVLRKPYTAEHLLMVLHRVFHGD